MLHTGLFFGFMAPMSIPFTSLTLSSSFKTGTGHARDKQYVRELDFWTDLLRTWITIGKATGLSLVCVAYCYGGADSMRLLRRAGHCTH